MKKIMGTAKVTGENRLIRFMLLSIILITAAAFIGCSDNSETGNHAKEDSAASSGYVQNDMGSKAAGDAENMTVHFIDVGQGDCTFIDYGSFEALVDCGEWNYSDEVIDYIAPFVDGELDLVIATHPDSDHIGGMQYIFREFKVGSVIDSGVIKNTVTYDNYKNAVNGESGCSVSDDEDEVIPLDSKKFAYIRIIETGDEDDDANERSVVSEVVCGGVKVLLTGDMGQKTEKANLDRFSHVQVLKAAHHGSSKSTSTEFLKKTSPDYVIISAGAGNSYGHPHKETLEKISKIGATVYQTMNEGTIVMRTDGKTYTFETGGSITVNEPEGSETYSTGSAGACDSTGGADSEGYIGNSNTGKFHYPDCSSVKRMSESNKVYFNSRNEAVGQGYEPCGNCKP